MKRNLILTIIFSMILLVGCTFSPTITIESPKQEPVSSEIELPSLYDGGMISTDAASLGGPGTGNDQDFGGSNLINIADLTSAGTVEAAILTEGGTGVYNITESDGVYEVLLINEAGLYAVLNDVIQFIEAGDNATLLKGTNWRLLYINGSGDVTELALGANDTFLESNGTTSAPAFRTLAAGDIPDISATYEVQLVNAAGLYAVLSDVTRFLEDLIDDLTPQLGAALDANDKNITGIGSAGFTQELDLGSKTGNFSVDFGTDQKQKVTLTANTMTLTLDTTFDRVGNYLLKIVNGGLATLTWASETGSVYFPEGTDPVLTSSGTDIVTFYYDGTNWYSVASLDFQ